MYYISGNGMPARRAGHETLWLSLCLEPSTALLLVTIARRVRLSMLVDTVRSTTLSTVAQK